MDFNLFNNNNFFNDEKETFRKNAECFKSNLAKNAVTPEAQNLIDEITSILEELANDPDVEYNEADVMAKVTALAEKGWCGSCCRGSIKF